ncbi:MAG: dihydropteroate synthase [Acidobacteriota bacterium]
MGILNVTPDSFSDGGSFADPDTALARAEAMVAEGVDIIDVGGESTRPGSQRISAETEALRVVAVIEAIVDRFDIPVSIDTTKSIVARRAIDAGAEIINDISALRFDPEIARIAAETRAGLVLMHSRGTFETLHSEPHVDDVMSDVVAGLQRAIFEAISHGVKPENIVVDIGIGFGKSKHQNLELIAKLDRLAVEFADFPILVGTSRKSFIGKILGGLPPEERLNGSLATAATAVWNGAKVVRVHDVGPTVQALKMTASLVRVR